MSISQGFTVAAGRCPVTNPFFGVCVKQNPKVDASRSPVRSRLEETMLPKAAQRLIFICNFFSAPKRGSGKPAAGSIKDINHRDSYFLFIRVFCVLRGLINHRGCVGRREKTLCSLSGQPATTTVPAIFIIANSSFLIAHYILITRLAVAFSTRFSFTAHY